jgi:hypothetical protein
MAVYLRKERRNEFHLDETPYSAGCFAAYKAAIVVLL